MKVSSKIKSAIIVGIAASALTAGANAQTPETTFSSKELRIVEQSLPEYPRRAELSGIEGYTVVEFTVLPDGSVAAPTIAQSNSRLFTRAALAAIESWKFEPVIAEAGEPVPVRTSMKFSFVGRQ
jgi:TonB family protein